MSSGSDALQTNVTARAAEKTDALLAVDPDWAWARYEPSAETPWGVKRAVHLFRRAGFGGDWREIQEALARGPQATIDRLLGPPESNAAFANEFDGHESAAARSGDRMVAAAWWLRRLRQSPWPLLEKVTLFWHGYFAIRSEPVANLRLTHAHVQLLRKHAFGEFPQLLGALAGDPAMYAGLGGEQNRKARPNLHFVRPWIEAFTLGPQAANASTVTNLARAWTGWFLYGDKLRFIEREHDQGSKRLLGQDSNWNRDEAVRLLAKDSATARNLARRLFRAFVAESASPPDTLLAPLAERIAHPARLVEVVEMVLRSNLFFSEQASAQRIKSPVELVVGLLRSLEGGTPGSRVAEELGHLGQRLDGPPTNQGWAGGVDWLNTVTMAARLRLCESLVHGSGEYGAGLNPARVAVANGFHAPESQARFLIDLLLPGQLADARVRRITEAAGPSPQSMKAVLETIIAQPEFQLN